MKSINVHNIFTCSQTAGPRNIRQMPQVFGLAMVLIGFSAPLSSAEDKPRAASTSGTGLVVVENSVSYLDGRPYPSYRLNAVDQGMFLEYGKGPNQCDTMNAREAMPRGGVEKSVWTRPRFTSFPAWRWQVPHVFCRLSGLTEESGSSGGRMSW